MFRNIMALLFDKRTQVSPIHIFSMSVGLRALPVTLDQYVTTIVLIKEE